MYAVEQIVNEIGLIQMSIGHCEDFQGGICVGEVSTMHFVGRVDGVQAGDCC